MIRTVAHALASNPLVYEAISCVLGGRLSEARLRRLADGIVAEIPGTPVVIDVGGGTGRLRDIWPRSTTYVCLDNELPKLQRFRARGDPGAPVLGDAARLPFPDRVADVVICVAMSHHLPDAVFDGFLAEAARVLKPSGKLVYFDAFVRPRRALSRLLWRYDRGAFPRTIPDIEGRLGRSFVRRHREPFAWAHHFVIWTGVPRVDRPADSP